LATVQAQELRDRIATFPRWNYSFQFGDGISTPLPDRGRINRIEQRRAYIFDRLLELTGGSLRGRRVLDIGCNAGFWSLAAIEAGADFVLGVDFKQEYVDQASLVFEAKEVAPARYRFEQGDIFGQPIGDRFDLVLCLGIMDHVDRPVELFELMVRTGAQVIVIDTEVSRAHSSVFEVSRLYDPRDAAGDGLVLVPSRSAVADLAGRHGLDTVALALNAGDTLGMEDYRRERRCAFICSGVHDLSALPAERRPSRLPWWVRDPRALVNV
jgi:SAM-dependent methyltransferase